MMRRLLQYWYPALSLVAFVYLGVRHDAGTLSAESYSALFNLNCIVFVFAIIASPPLRRRRIPRKYRKAIAEREAREAQEAEQARLTLAAASDAPKTDVDAPVDATAITTDVPPRETP